MTRCAVCNYPFGVAETRRRYCSLQCRNRASYLRRRGPLLAYMVNRYNSGSLEFLAKRSTPRAKYQRQKRRAADRGIAWLFTFETWVNWWGADYSRRGTGTEDLVMARYGDRGPYSPFNCYKTTPAQNVRDARRAA